MVIREIGFKTSRVILIPKGGRVASGRTAEVFCEQVRAAVARSKQRRRVAIVIADNLKTHTPAGSLLVRRTLAELQEHLSSVHACL